MGREIIDWNSDGKILTADQKRFYQQNGYLVVRKCVPETAIDRYNERFKYIVHADKSEFPYISVMRDITLSNTQVVKDVNQVTKIQTWQDDEVLFDYCKTPLIVDILKDLIGTPQSNLVAMHTVLINKPPDTGAMSSRHPMHQDLQYFPFRPADFICTADNGCLTFVPGTHKGPLLPHVYPDWQANNKAYHGIRDFDPSTPRVHIEMEKGDTVFFHPLIHHGSGANKTDGFRRAISCHYANDDLCYYSEERNETQDAIDNDLMQIFERKMKKFETLGLEMDVKDLDYLQDSIEASQRY